MSVASMISRAGQTAQFERPVMSIINGEHIPSAWVPVGLPMPCWKQDADSDTRQDYLARGIVTTSAIYVAIDPDAQAGDRVSVSQSGQPTRMHVVRGSKNMAGLFRAFVVYVDEMK